MIFVDTGWFVAIVNTGDALHERAMGLLAALNAPTITTEYVLLETFNTFSGIPFRQRCHEVIGRLVTGLNINVIRGDVQLFNAGLRLHRDRPDKSWSLVDCISFQLMTVNRITQAFAHDHHFEQAGFKAMLR